MEGGGGGRGCGGGGGGGQGTRLADASSFVQMTQTWRHMFVSFPGSPTRCFMFQWENFFGIRSNTITLIVMETGTCEGWWLYWLQDGCCLVVVQWQLKAGT